MQSDSADIRGNSENPVDDKGRVSLPTKYSPPLSRSDLILVKAEDPEYPCLRLYNLADYTAWIDSWFAGKGGYNASNLKHQRKLVQFNNAIEPVKIDASNRIRIDPKLREHAQINDKVRFVGMSDSVWIYNPEILAKLEAADPFDED